MIGFLLSHDWLNRPGPSYAFKIDHLLFIFIAMAIGVAAAILLRRCQRKTISIVLVSLWAFGVTIELFYYIFLYVLCGIHYEDWVFNISSMLPFHSCSMFMFVFPVAFFVKNKYVKTAALNFLVIINMIMGFITLFVGCPVPGYSALSFFGMQTLIYHAIIVIVPLIMVVTKYYDVEFYDFKYGLIAFGCLSLFMWIFDAISGSDYFYFYDGHTFPVFKFISENVHHLVWTLLIVSCYIITGLAMHFLIIGIKYWISKRQKAAE